MIDRMKAWAEKARRDVLTVYLAGRDPRVPRSAKVLALLVAAYALSPIDLIPDFIPVLGYLDDLILLPLAILLVVRLIPPALLAELRAEATARLSAGRPRNWGAAAVILLLWAAIAAAFLWWGLTVVREG